MTLMALLILWSLTPPTSFPAPYLPIGSECDAGTRWERDRRNRCDDLAAVWSVALSQPTRSTASLRVNSPASDQSSTEDKTMADAKTKVVPVEPTEAMRQIGGEMNCPTETLTSAMDYACDVYRAMLAAAPQPAASDVPHDVVRALEWNTGGFAHTDTGIMYRVSRQPVYWRLEKINLSSQDNSAHPSEDEAKAAAQADFESRVRSALATPAPSTSTEEAGPVSTSDTRMMSDHYDVAFPADLLSAKPSDFKITGDGAEIEALRAENARLRELMKPFSDDRNADPLSEPFGIPDEHPVTLTDDNRTSVNVGHFRRIREALSALSR